MCKIVYTDNYYFYILLITHNKIDKLELWQERFMRNVTTKVKIIKLVILFDRLIGDHGPDLLGSVPMLWVFIDFFLENLL